MRTATLLLLGFVGTLATDELLSVNVVIRHADRSATYGWATPESPSILFRGNGELTDLGIDNAYAQGKDFKERYVKTAFVDKKFLPSEVFVRSSSVNRCLMSAASFTNALFKDTSKDHAVIPPIYTVAEADDELLFPLLSCTDGRDDVISKYNLTSNNNVLQNSAVAMMQTEWPAACATVSPSLVDAIIAELPNKKIKLRTREGVHMIELLAGAGANFNDLRIKRVAGVLTKTLLDNFNTAATCIGEACNGIQKFRVYYTHDVTVVALSHIFGVLDFFNGVTPAFSSAVVFETRRNASGPYVKIYMKNGQKANFVDSNNCGNGCSLAAVTASASPFAISSQIACA